MSSLLQRLADDEPDDREAEWEIKSGWLTDELRMLFDSRPRLTETANNPAVSDTVVNYGLEELLPAPRGDLSRSGTMCQQITLMLRRFEPRLENVSVNVHHHHFPRVQFIITAMWRQEELRFTLIWDDVMSSFLLSESA